MKKVIYSLIDGDKCYRENKQWRGKGRSKKLRWYSIFSGIVRDVLHDKVKLKKRFLTKVMDQPMGISKAGGILASEAVCAEGSMVGVFEKHGGMLDWVVWHSVWSMWPTVKWMNESPVSWNLLALRLNSKYLTVASKALSGLAPPTSQVSISTSSLPPPIHSAPHLLYLPPPPPPPTLTFQLLDQVMPFSGPVPCTLCSVPPRTLGQKKGKK